MGATNKSELSVISKKLEQFNLLLINSQITTIAVNLLTKYRLSHNLAMADSLIAAASSHARWKLFTYNLRDFRFIEDIALFDLSDQ